MFIPVLDGPHSCQAANEAAAVSKLLSINKLQTKYSAAHPEKGFVCELPLLKPAERLEDTDYDPLRFLVTSTQSGYKFALSGCYARRQRNSCSLPSYCCSCREPCNWISSFLH